MSKIKIGKRVFLKDTKEYGIVVGLDIKSQKLIVCTDNGNRLVSKDVIVLLNLLREIIILIKSLFRKKVEDETAII